MKMQKQKVNVVISRWGKTEYIEKEMLTYKGLGMHSDIKGHYSFTHIKSGYGSLVNERMTYAQARKLVEKMAEVLDWTQEIKYIMPTREKQKEISAMWKKAYEER